MESSSEEFRGVRKSSSVPRSSEEFLCIKEFRGVPRSSEERGGVPLFRGASWSCEELRGVARSCEEFRGVLRRFEEFREVAKSSEKLRGVPNVPLVYGPSKFRALPLISSPSRRWIPNCSVNKHSVNDISSAPFRYFCVPDVLQILSSALLFPM